MTTQEIVDYYADLLVMQYKGKPKAYAHIQALVKILIMGQLPVAVMNAFNLTGTSPAVGKQLDMLAKYIGVTRVGFGFNGQAITLNDADFRSLLQMATLRNTAMSSLSVIQAFLHQFFSGAIFVFDYQNMQLSYFINSSVGSQELVQVFVTEGLLPRPMAVGVASVIYAPDTSLFFGMRTYDLAAYNNTPFNNYDTYDSSWLWLSYSNAIM